MTYIHSSLFILHILFGSAALILFWFPMYSQKGQFNHKKFGRWYRNVMYMVAATGALMALIVLAIPLVVKHQFANHENAESIASNIRFFWSFLLYLALLSYTSTRHGDAVLKAKNNRSLLRSFSYVVPVIALLIGGGLLIIAGVTKPHTLHVIFGILGLVLSITMLRYIYASNIRPRAYIFEHIGSMIGSGIGAYTAFLTFGARRFLEDAGEFQLLFWIAPGVIGSIASFVLCRKYGRIFGINKAQNETLSSPASQ